MFDKYGTLILKPETLPDGVPFLNYDYFKKMSQKCQQCSTSLKNKKKYYIGEPIVFDNGFWTFKKVCRQCGNQNFTGVR